MKRRGFLAAALGVPFAARLGVPIAPVVEPATQFSLKNAALLGPKWAVVSNPALNPNRMYEISRIDSWGHGHCDQDYKDDDLVKVMPDGSTRYYTTFWHGSARFDWPKFEESVMSHPYHEGPNV